MSLVCNKQHRREQMFKDLPEDQSGSGRHKCCGCAYETGYQAGLLRIENITVNLDSLKESQAGTVRHKSPHAAFALGYNDGVKASYK